MEKLSSFIDLLMAIPMDRLSVFVILAAVGVVVFALYVHLTVVKSLFLKDKP